MIKFNRKLLCITFLCLISFSLQNQPTGYRLNHSQYASKNITKMKTAARLHYNPEEVSHRMQAEQAPNDYDQQYYSPEDPQYKNHVYNAPKDATYQRPAYNNPAAYQDASYGNPNYNTVPLYNPKEVQYDLDADYKDSDQSKYIKYEDTYLDQYDGINDYKEINDELKYDINIDQCLKKDRELVEKYQREQDQNEYDFSVAQKQYEKEITDNHYYFIQNETDFQTKEAQIVSSIMNKDKYPYHEMPVSLIQIVDQSDVQNQHQMDENQLFVSEHLVNEIQNMIQKDQYTAPAPKYLPKTPAQNYTSKNYTNDQYSSHKVYAKNSDACALTKMQIAKVVQILKKLSKRYKDFVSDLTSRQTTLKQKCLDNLKKFQCNNLQKWKLDITSLKAKITRNQYEIQESSEFIAKYNKQITQIKNIIVSTQKKYEAENERLTKFIALLQSIKVKLESYYGVQKLSTAYKNVKTAARNNDYNYFMEQANVIKAVVHSINQKFQNGEKDADNSAYETLIQIDNLIQQSYNDYTAKSSYNANNYEKSSYPGFHTLDKEVKEVKVRTQKSKENNKIFQEQHAKSIIKINNIIDLLIEKLKQAQKQSLKEYQQIIKASNTQIVELQKLIIYQQEQTARLQGLIVSSSAQIKVLEQKVNKCYGPLMPQSISECNRLAQKEYSAIISKTILQKNKIRQLISHIVLMSNNQQNNYPTEGKYQSPNQKQSYNTPNHTQSYNRIDRKQYINEYGNEKIAKREYTPKLNYAHKIHKLDKEYLNDSLYDKQNLKNKSHPTLNYQHRYQTDKVDLGNQYSTTAYETQPKASNKNIYSNVDKGFGKRH